MEHGQTENMKAVIFDFDGTIADSLLIGLEGVNMLADKYNYQPLNDPDYLRSKGMRRIVKEDLQLKWYQLPLYVRSLKKILLPKLNELQAYDGMPDMITSLKDQQLSLFILTSNIQKAVDHIISKYNLNFFERTYTSIPSFRKHIAIRKFLNRYNYNSNEVIYVGDEVRDVEACKKAGIPVIAVTWGMNDRNALQEASPNYIVESPEELKQLLNDISVA